jgi:hypothetical protein
MAIAASVSVSVPIWFGLMRMALAAPRYIARFAFDGVAEDVGRAAGGSCDLGGGFERPLRRGDEVRLDAWQARVAGLQRLAFAALQQSQRTWWHLDRAASQDVPFASAQVLGSATVGPDTLSIGSS